MIKISRHFLLPILLLFINLQSFAKEDLSSGFMDFKNSHPVELTGDFFMLALPLGSLALNFIKEDTLEGAKQNLFTQGTNLMITTFLKVALNDIKLGKYKIGQRPDGEDYNMPSGHTSITFASSFHVLKRYNYKYALPFFALAFFTAFSRHYAQKHDLPAIAGGVLVGFSSSFLFTSPFEEKRDFHGSLFFEEGKLGLTLVGKL